MIARLQVLVLIALRNLVASPINLIIGGLIFFGTVFFVAGGALLDSLADSMSRSVVGSVAGHVQIYGAKSRDMVSLYGNMGGRDSELDAIDAFPKLKAALEAVPNVKTVVPMGVSGALITSGNTVDMTLERLRNLYKAREGQPTDERLKALPRAEVDARILATREHVRQIVKVLESDAARAKELIKEQALDPATQAALAKATGDDFWAGFEADPWGNLEFLENRIAPQVSDAQLVFLRYVGTDLESFQRSFDRLEIVDGQKVPSGQRGFLIAKYLYEDQLKLKTARRLDKIHDALTLKKLTIAEDPDLQRYVRENRAQTRDIILQLDALKSAAMVRLLQEKLDSKEAELTALLAAFFETTDGNFEDRYAFFYAKLAPMLELYKVRIGDTLTIKAFSKSGYINSVNVKVYGTFAFKGLEKSPLAGGVSLMDLMSFRDLYGYLTSDKAEEIAAIQKTSTVKQVTRDTAEDSLFGDDSGGKTVVAEATPGVIDADSKLSGTGKKYRQEDLVKRVYTQAEMESGVVLNAAVILKEGSPASIRQAVVDIDALSEQQNLGIKAVSWQQAAGFLGQFITIARGAMYFFVFIIFVIAMLIIFIAMMMATLQRTQMIGTLRAIGAQRGFVLAMVMVETLTLGVIFGALGMATGAGLIGALGRKGIGAPNDIAQFFFSGPRLLPTMAPSNLIAALVLILLVSLLSTLLPAIIATRVSPLRAMQADE